MSEIIAISNVQQWKQPTAKREWNKNIKSEQGTH